MITKSSLDAGGEKTFLGMTLARLSEKILQCLYYEVDEKNSNVTFVISTDDLSETIKETMNSMTIGTVEEEKYQILKGIIFHEVLEKIRAVTEGAMKK